ncbi:unnamed protein product, partial [Pocillopora meandrina]
WTKTQLSKENNIQASKPDDEDFVLFEVLKPPKDASYEIPTLQILYLKEGRYSKALMPSLSIIFSN